MTPDSPLKPTTTKEEDLHTHAARSINLIWEFTQALIAAGVVGSILYVAIWLIVNDPASRGQSFLVLDGAFNLVIGFYFGRTNHARTGGLGGRPE